MCSKCKNCTCEQEQPVPMFTPDQHGLIDVAKRKIKQLETDVMFGSQHNDELIDAIVKVERALEDLRRLDPTVKF